IRRQRRCVLRAEKPPSTNPIPQKEGSPTRLTPHSSPSLTLSTNKFLGRNFVAKVATTQSPSATLQKAQGPVHERYDATIPLAVQERSDGLLRHNLQLCVFRTRAHSAPHLLFRGVHVDFEADV